MAMYRMQESRFHHHHHRHISHAFQHAQQLLVDAAVSAVLRQAAVMLMLCAKPTTPLTQPHMC